jgi:hypothetical protein
MALVQDTSPQLTPKEAEIMRYDAEREDKQMAYGMRMKELDIEVQKLEQKWNTLLRIPILIIKLPLLCILGIAYIVHAIVKVAPSEDFWRLLK